MAIATGTQSRVRQQTGQAEGPSSSWREEVARVAYELFERRGCVNGFDQQDWFEAERIVAQRRRGGPFGSR